MRNPRFEMVVRVNVNRLESEVLLHHPKQRDSEPFLICERNRWVVAQKPSKNSDRQ